MKTETIPTLTLAAGLALTAAGHAADDPASVQKELMRLEDGAMERWRQGDPMGWSVISAPEVTYVDPSLAQPLLGHEQYTRYLEALKGKISYGASEYMRPKAAVYGDVAVLTFNYRGSTRKADGTVKSFVPWDTTEVYARLNGQWKIIHTHWSYFQHTAPDRVDVPVPVVQVPDEPSGVLGELMRLEAAAMERYRKGNALAFCEISAPSVTYFDSRTPQRIDGLAALKEEMAQQSGQSPFDVMEFLDPRVQVHGDTAVLFYRFLSTALRPDGAIAQRRAWNCTQVYAKLDGQWRIVHTHRSFIGAQPPAGFASETD
jgi:ketosteroid isomerase-like protein